MNKIFEVSVKAGYGKCMLEMQVKLNAGNAQIRLLMLKNTFFSELAPSKVKNIFSFHDLHRISVVTFLNGINIFLSPCIPILSHSPPSCFLGYNLPHCNV